MRTALVCDSMSAYAGAERVIEEILRLYPSADVFAVLDLVPEDQRGFLGGRAIHTSFLQRMPAVRRYYRRLLPLWGVAVEQFDLSGYDLVISSHHSVAHGVITRPYQRHISYTHSPMRYAWDLQAEYLSQSALDRGPLSWLARRMLHSARLWDFAAAQRPDILVANSSFVQERIRKFYRRHASVIHPPVDISRFKAPRTDKRDVYLALSRLVPYKRVDLLIETFRRMPERRLLVIGKGPDLPRLSRNLPLNVELAGWQSADIIEQQLATSKAFVFAGVEDFGIALVEAQAAGVPVIAYKGGGAVETVRDLAHARPSGILFEQQTCEAIAAAIETFEQHQDDISPSDCRDSARRFAADRFRQKFRSLVAETMDAETSEIDSLPRRNGAEGTLRA